MKIKPLADRVLIKIDEGELKTASGLIIPQTAQEKTQTGVVVAVGDLMARVGLDDRSQHLGVDACVVVACEAAPGGRPAPRRRRRAAAGRSLQQPTAIRDPVTPLADQRTLHPARYRNTLPGFITPLGSRASLIRRMAAISSGLRDLPR